MLVMTLICFQLEEVPTLILLFVRWSLTVMFFSFTFCFYIVTYVTKTQVCFEVLCMIVMCDGMVDSTGVNMIREKLQGPFVVVYDIYLIICNT